MVAVVGWFISRARDERREQEYRVVRSLIHEVEAAAAELDVPADQPAARRLRVELERYREAAVESGSADTQGVVIQKGMTLVYPAWCALRAEDPLVTLDHPPRLPCAALPVRDGWWRPYVR